MKRLQSAVRYLVPDHQFCNHFLDKSTPSTRCRFCTDLGKGTYVCVLHNQPLSVHNGVLILKTDACIRASRFALQQIDDPPIVPVKEQIKQAIAEYRKAYRQAISEGLSDAAADIYAKETTYAKRS